MTLKPASAVHAVHDIHQGVNLVRNGTHGRVVKSWPNWLRATYSVEFEPHRSSAANVPIYGLTELDVQTD